MKLIFRYKHIVVAFFSLFATVACDDFLDTAPANLLSSDEGIFRNFIVQSGI